jgi:caffeoyl-CoA O-methyltransferase
MKEFIQIPENLEHYILSHSEQEDELLKELSRETNVKIYHPRMLSGHLQGQLLSMLVKMIRPRRILEIGTFTGYSAICMAKAMDNQSHLDTIEINDELETFTRSFIERAGLNEKISLHIGNAIDILPTLKESYDLVFIDGNKAEYLDYYHLVFDKIPSGGFIFADNVLWDGKVISKNLRDNDYFTHGIREFNAFLKEDQRVEKVIFPIRDGIFVIRKK